MTTENHKLNLTGIVHNKAIIGEQYEERSLNNIIAAEVKIICSIYFLFAELW
jgi:hypothetical protein